MRNVAKHIYAEFAKDSNVYSENLTRINFREIISFSIKDKEKNIEVYMDFDKEKESICVRVVRLNDGELIKRICLVTIDDILKENVYNTLT